MATTPSLPAQQLAGAGATDSSNSFAVAILNTATHAAEGGDAKSRLAAREAASNGSKGPSSAAAAGGAATAAATGPVSSANAVAAAAADAEADRRHSSGQAPKGFNLFTLRAEPRQPLAAAAANLSFTSAAREAAGNGSDPSAEGRTIHPAQLTLSADPRHGGDGARGLHGRRGPWGAAARGPASVSTAASAAAAAAEAAGAAAGNKFDAAARCIVDIKGQVLGLCPPPTFTPLSL